MNKGQHIFENAAKKYGKESFTIEILHDNINTEAELNSLEIEYITQYNCTNKQIGYNLTKGGDGGFTDEMRRLATAAYKRNGISPSHLKALTKGRKLAGYNVTEKTKVKISKSMKKYYDDHPEHLKKITEINQKKAPTRLQPSIFW